MGFYDSVKKGAGIILKTTPVTAIPYSIAKGENPMETMKSGFSETASLFGFGNAKGVDPSLQKAPQDPAITTQQEYFRNLQRQSVGGLQDLYGNMSAEDMAKMEAQNQVNQLQNKLSGVASANESARRALQTKIAQRGLQNTSIGLGALNANERALAAAQQDIPLQQQQILANIPLAAYNERLKRQQALFSTANAGLGQPGVQPTYYQDPGQKSALENLLGMGAQAASIYKAAAGGA